MDDFCVFGRQRRLELMKGFDLSDINKLNKV